MTLPSNLLLGGNLCEIRLFIYFPIKVAAVTILDGPRPKETGNQRVAGAHKTKQNTTKDYVLFVTSCKWTKTLNE